MTPTALSRQIDVPPNRITQIIQGKRAITGDTALRLGHWFKTSAQFWLNLQAAYDLRIATEEIGRAVAKLPTQADDRRDAQADEAARRLESIFGLRGLLVAACDSIGACPMKRLEYKPSVAEFQRRYNRLGNHSAMNAKLHRHACCLSQKKSAGNAEAPQQASRLICRLHCKVNQ